MFGVRFRILINITLERRYVIHRRSSAGSRPVKTGSDTKTDVGIANIAEKVLVIDLADWTANELSTCPYVKPIPLFLTT